MGEMFIPPTPDAPKMETWRELAEKLRVRVTELEAQNTELLAAAENVAMWYCNVYDGTEESFNELIDAIKKATSALVREEARGATGEENV